MSAEHCEHGKHVEHEYCLACGWTPKKRAAPLNGQGPMAKFPTTGDNNDFLAGAPTARNFTARDLLLYLFSDCKSWKEDVDGDAHDDGTPYAIVHHDIRISDGHLEELMDMAGIAGRGMMETTLERLTRENDEDLAKS